MNSMFSLATGSAFTHGFLAFGPAFVAEVLARSYDRLREKR
jgi:hypothetical protein